MGKITFFMVLCFIFVISGATVFAEMTGTHGKTALVMLPLLLFGLISGIYMNQVKKKRRFLPLLHGANNLVVIILALSQIRTGWWVLNTYVWGG